MKEIKIESGKVKFNVSALSKKLATFGWFVPLGVIAISPDLRQHLPVAAIVLPVCSVLTDMMISDSDEQIEESKKR